MDKAELITYLKLFTFKRTSPNIKFVIFHQGRTGSTLLADLLNSHPDICCDGEILTKKKIFPFLFIQAKSISCKKTYGFKVKVHHLFQFQRVNPYDFFQYLIKKKWKIIFLWRKNIFLQALSLIIGKTRGVWEHRASNDPIQLPKFTIPPADILKNMHLLNGGTSYQKKILRAFPYLELVYEIDLLNSTDHQKTADKVFDYLGLPRSTISTGLVKIAPPQWYEIVKNHQELMHAVKNSPFANFLPE